MMSAIESTLYAHFSDGEADPLGTTILMIYSLNRDEMQKSAVETIQKYLQNIVDHPNEEKYLQIKRSNKVFTVTIQLTEFIKRFD